MTIRPLSPEDPHKNHLVNRTIKSRSAGCRVGLQPPPRVLCTGCLGTLKELFNQLLCRNDT